MPICPSCGSDEPEGSGSFCGECGASLAPVEPEAAHGVVCPACGNEEPEGSPFCGSCGESLTREDPEPAAAPPPAREPAPARERPRVPRAAIVVGLVVLAAAAVAAVLLGTGVVGGGDSAKSADAFASDVNEHVLAPLVAADQSAAGSASGGARIRRAAEDASAYLRSLNGLSDDQRRDVQVLLAFVAVNERYGRALADLDSNDEASRLALEGAAAVARSALATIAPQLGAGLEVPSEEAFAVPAPPAETTTEMETAPATTAAAMPDPALAYVQQVDALLNESHAVLLGLRSFVPRATNGSIGKAAAVGAARSYLEQRRRELAQAQALTAPAAFAATHALLLRSLQTSVADDEALVAWTMARRDGGNAQPALDEVNRLGEQATALKRSFLRVYGPARQRTSGRAPESLPDSF